MYPNLYTGVVNAQVSRLPIHLVQLEGLASGLTAATRYLQLHDSAVTPAAGSVPVWQMVINQTAQFQETLQVTNLNLIEGLFVAVSTTDGTYTATTDTVDLVVGTDVNHISTNVVGDKTSAVNSLTAWTTATANGGLSTSTKKLYGLVIKELLGATAYIYITTDQSPGNNEPPGFLATLLPNATQRYYFGVDAGGGNAGAGAGGLQPLSQSIVVGTGLTQYRGCTITTANASGVAIGSGFGVTPGQANILAITN